MSFPALDDFADDIRVGFMTWVVYMRLQRSWLNHASPRELKISGLADAWKMRRASIIAALDRLVEWGYLVEHPRSSRGIRCFTLAWSRAHPDTNLVQFPKRTDSAAA